MALGARKCLGSRMEESLSGTTDKAFSHCWLGCRPQLLTPRISLDGPRHRFRRYPRLLLHPCAMGSGYRSCVPKVLANIIYTAGLALIADTVPADEVDSWCVTVPCPAAHGSPLIEETAQWFWYSMV